MTRARRIHVSLSLQRASYLKIRRSFALGHGPTDTEGSGMPSRALSTLLAMGCPFHPLGGCSRVTGADQESVHVKDLQGNEQPGAGPSSPQEGSELGEKLKLQLKNRVCSGPGPGRTKSPRTPPAGQSVFLANWAQSPIEVSGKG